MTKRLPSISEKYKICFICEGNEEYKYLQRLTLLHVWNDVYEISLVNAAGNGSIPARYQDRYQNGSYDVVLVFCDTEKKPYEQYEDIKRKINEFHGVDHAADEVVIFANPCTLQIVLKHWTDEVIKSPAKKVNAPLIQKYIGILDYKGRADQIDQLMEKITIENYQAMLKQVCQANRDERIVGSTNFGKIARCLENADITWMKDLNAVLDS